MRKKTQTKILCTILLVVGFFGGNYAIRQLRPHIIRTRYRVRDDQNLVHVTLTNPKKSKIEVEVELLYCELPDDSGSPPLPPLRQVSQHTLDVGETRTDIIPFSIHPVLNRHLVRPMARVLSYRTL